MGKFKPGDIIIISDIVQLPRDPGICIEMRRYVGRTAKITKFYSANHEDWYYINIDDGTYIWDERWLSLVKSRESAKKIKYPINWNEIISKGYGKI